jgi:hypothetical protein
MSRAAVVSTFFGRESQTSDAPRGASPASFQGRNSVARRSAAALTALLVSSALSSASARAQDNGAPPAFGEPEDTVAFVRGLVQFGYHDLAKEIVSKAAEGGGGPEAQAQFDLLKAEIGADEARFTSDHLKRIEHYKTSIKAYEDFIRKYESSPKAAEARLQVAEISRKAGESVIAQLAKEKDAAKLEALREEGKNFFIKALTEAQTRVAALGALEDKRTEQQTAEYMVMRFAVANLHYSSAMLYENREGVNAKLALTSAKEVLDDLELDEQLCPIAVVYESRSLRAKILIEFGSLDQAEDIFRINCEELADAVAKDASVVNDEVSRDTIAGAFLAYGTFLSSVKNPTDWSRTEKLLEQLQKMMPTQVMKSKDGRMAMVVLASAHRQEGRGDKARKLAQEVFEADPAGAAGQRASAFLDASGASIEGGGGAWIEVLKGCRARRDVPNGEKTLNRILAAGGKPEDLSEALFQMGSLYFEMRRYYWDAAVCFQTVCEEYPATPRAPEAKFNEALAFSNAAQVDKEKFWKEKSKDAREALLKHEVWKNSQQAKDMTFVVAEDSRAERKYAEAADLYLKVTDVSPKYGEAQLYAGEMMEILADEAGNRNQTAKQAESFAKAQECYANGARAMMKAATETLNKAEAATHRKNAFTAQTKIVAILLRPEVKQPEKAAKLLDEIETTFKDDKEKLATLWSVRIKGYIQQGRGEEASKILEAKLPEIKDPGQIASLTLGVAAEIDRDAFTKAKTDPNAPEAMKLWAVAHRLYGLSVDNAKKAGGGKATYGQVGLRLLSIPNKLAGRADDLSLFNIDPKAPVADKPNIERAATAFKMASESSEPSDAPAGLDRIRGAARCYALLGRWDDALGVLQEVQRKYRLFTPENRLEVELAKQMPDLPEVYQDLATAYLQAGKKQKAYYEQALNIANSLVVNSVVGGRTYWECRYLMLATLYASQNYTVFDASLATLELEAPDVDGNKFGVKAKVDELRKFRSKNIIDK